MAHEPVPPGAAVRRPRVLKVPAAGAAAGDPGYAAALDEAARALRAGGLVAFPTETVYGLGALITQPEAVERIFRVKGRPPDNPLIVHVRDEAMARSLVAAWPEAARRLAAAFWPGPLTLVLPRGPAVPAAVTAGLDTVAVRCPGHPVARELIAAAGAAIAAPSANRSGRPSPTTARHVLEDLGGAVDVVLDGGPCPLGVESTVVDLTCDPPAVLRPGGVTLEQLQAVLGTVGEGPPSPQDPPRSPGLKYRHYAPRAPLVVVDAGEAPDPRRLGAALRRAAAGEVAAGRMPGFLLPLELCGEGWPGPAVPCGELGDPAGMAATLYGALRALDGIGADVIFAWLPPPAGLGRAVRNRLLKAAARVVRAETEGAGDGT